MTGRNPFTEVPRLLQALAVLRAADPVEVADLRDRFVAAVSPVPAVVAQPA
jgi:hypothetical protein